MEHISAEFRSTPMLEAAASVVKTLCEAGFESGLVGGCVRDLLLVPRFLLSQDRYFVVQV